MTTDNQLEREELERLDRETFPLTTDDLIKQSGYQKKWLSDKFNIPQPVLSNLIRYEKGLQDLRLFLTEGKPNA